jgi:hypothetical protein
MGLCDAIEKTSFISLASEGRRCGHTCCEHNVGVAPAQAISPPPHDYRLVPFTSKSALRPPHLEQTNPSRQSSTKFTDGIEVIGNSAMSQAQAAV